jgi:hypothetical protein
VLKQKPYLRECLTRCRFCQIFFITHPRNANRNDIGCPFGCREAHRRKESTKRSVEYYRTKEGKGKKKDLNAHRYVKDILQKTSKEPGKEKIDAEDIGTAVDQPTLTYLQTVTSLIEARVVHIKEIMSMIRTILRQHSIDEPIKLLYATQNCRAIPP